MRIVFQQLAHRPSTSVFKSPIFILSPGGRVRRPYTTTTKLLSSTPKQTTSTVTLKMGSTAINLPTIRLDTTLADLYKLADPSTAHLRLGLVLCGVNSAIALSSSFPRNKKYLYQDSPFNNIPPSDLKDASTTNPSSTKATDLQRSIALKYLSLIPQRDAFIAGGPSTPAIFFNVSPGSPEQEAHDRHEAEMTLSVLDPDQKPKLVFCSGPADIPIKELGIERLAVKIMLDDLEKQKYPLVVDMQTQWFLNSKAGLAESGLPTPRAEVVHVEGYLPGTTATECCETCKEEDAKKGRMKFVPAGCKGVRGKWVEEQVTKIVEKIEARQTPFVFKTQQTFGGAGTWVISNKEKKRELVEELTNDETGVLRKLLSQVTAKNQQMKPGAVVLSEMVRDPVGDYGVTFLMKKGGEAKFLAASEQMINEDNAWIGSTINYARQEKLRKKFEGIMRQTAEWVGKHGYIGPVGIDILETKDIPQGEKLQENGTSSADGDKTAHYIVDLNVRTSGSLALPLLKGHFTSRGMTCASSFSTTVKGSRKEFMETWREEFESGRMLIMAWYEDNADQEGVKSIGDVVVGGKDEKNLQDLMKRVRETTEEVTF
ncbi:hypothetical protein B0T20DRAFT_417085 [Sordaria brevicollis]|uniref:ATP-grasp domain-containing protein n=1 Tax=Sordaria brevicollis TaxID=83679 RepID=A0AAE0U9S7_SORBR|nr:hypothetical protein B0T20DRAFT_417085 [Sordaria brevicollis]